MVNIKTLNKIDAKGLDVLRDAGYAVGEDMENPDSLMVRSAKLHDMVFNDKLVAIARAGIGVDNIPIDRCTEAGIVVFSTPGANAESVKEMALCALILGSRDLVGGMEWVKSLAGHENVAAEVEKGKSAFVGPEIMGKTLGIIGLGAIGSRTAKAAVNLGMKVLGYDPYLSVDGAWLISSRVTRARDVETVYKNSDYILVQVHYTDETRHMLGADAISKMKDGVCIINLARGELVDDDALLSALESGKVARYITDFPNSKTAGAKNVIAFPHLGASTPESETKCAIMAAEELTDYLRDGTIRNSVNLPALSLERVGVCRLCVIHENIPRMITGFLDFIGAADINVEHMINKARGDIAYTIIDTDSPISEEIVQKIASAPTVKRVRLL